MFCVHVRAVCQIEKSLDVMVLIREKKRNSKST